VQQRHDTIGLCEIIHLWWVVSSDAWCLGERESEGAAVAADADPPSEIGERLEHVDNGSDGLSQRLALVDLLGDANLSALGRSRRNRATASGTGVAGTESSKDWRSVGFSTRSRSRS